MHNESLKPLPLQSAPLGDAHSEPPAKKKKSKQQQDVLDGKRVLDIAIARALAPAGAYVYETTDGRRVRVFYGKRRLSTSSMISIGKGLAILHCLRWAWNTAEKFGSGEKCPFDLSKIKTTD